MSASDAILKRRPPPAIPIVVLTGFLGSGKTTLLNAWVKTPAFADAAVVINEFGAIGLDHLLVEKAEGTILTLSSGCLCCTIRGDMIETLEDLVRRRDNGRIPPFARLVIETTGLADPAPILNTIMFHPYLPLRYRIDSVVTAVDAVHGAATIAAHEEALKQVAVADTLILTKTDLLPSGQDGSTVLALMRQLNPGARVLNAAKGEAKAETILGEGLFALDQRNEAVRDWLNPARYEEEPAPHRHGAHDHGHGHAHHAVDVNRHDARIKATCLTHDAPLDAAAFGMFVDLLRANYGGQLLRVKGIVALATDPDRPLVIHGVQHTFHPAHKLEAWPDEDHRSRLVFIARDLPPGIIEALWQGFFGPPSIDRPDGAALAAASIPAQTGGLFG